MTFNFYLMVFTEYSRYGYITSGKCEEIWKGFNYEKDHISNIGDDSWNVIGVFW